MADVRLTVAGGEPGVAVARRVVRAVAAATDLSIDRLEDAVLACDLLLGDRRPGTHSTVVLKPRQQSMELLFETGHTNTGSPPAGVDPLVARLATRVWSAPEGGEDTVYLHVLVGEEEAGDQG